MARISSLPALAIQPVDVGNALLSAERIRGLRSENRLRDAALDREARISDLSAQAASGNQDALLELGGVDPSRALDVQTLRQNISEFTRKASAAEVETAQQRAATIGRLATVINEADPAERPALYEKARLFAVQALGIPPEQIPERYDESFVNRALAQARIAADELGVEKFGQPVAGVNAEGKPTFFRAGSRGSVQPVEGFSPPPGGAQSSIGKLRDDLRAGRIGQADFDAAVARLSDGGLTTSQERTNAGIDAARAKINELGLTRDEIITRSQEATSTGRDNPDFDPFLAGLVRQAAQRKFGDDPEHASFQTLIHGEPAATEAAPAPEAQPTEATSTEPTLPRKTGIAAMRPSLGGREEPGANLSPDLKARADRGDVFTEAELRRLLQEQPETFRALRDYFATLETRTRR